MRKNSGVTLIEVMIVIAIIGILLVVFFPWGVFTNNQTAIDCLETQGWSDVKITEKHVFLVRFKGCSRSDAAMFDATGKNPKREEKNVSVCVGWPFKGATIRTE